MYKRQVFAVRRFPKRRCCRAICSISDTSTCLLDSFSYIGDFVFTYLLLIQRLTSFFVYFTRYPRFCADNLYILTIFFCSCYIVSVSIFQSSPLCILFTTFCHWPFLSLICMMFGTTYEPKCSQPKKSVIASLRDKGLNSCTNFKFRPTFRKL